MENRVANLLSRIVTLEEHFNTCPSDVAEQRHRDELIWYATIPPLSPVAAHFLLLVSSMQSRSNCSCCSSGGSCHRLLVVAGIRTTSVEGSSGKGLRRDAQNTSQATARE